MDISCFDYNLPEELIAQFPAESRGGSRLLSANCVSGSLTDCRFEEIPDILPDDAFLVVNNSRVIPARIPAKKITGGKSEVFYLKSLDEYHFKGLVKGNFTSGSILICGAEKLKLEKKLENGVWIILSSIPVQLLLDTCGIIPLPPYIQRGLFSEDSKRYQTVYSRCRGSVAAPTAGLHFTSSILDKIRSRGIPVVELTLHVGIGTFRPIKVENINDHTMHEEEYEISSESASIINKCLSESRRMVCVGTTSVRTVESAMCGDGFIEPGKKATSLFIKPGYNFKAVKGIITNFHQPKSSLMVMVSTFMGLDFARRAYLHAVESGYRFFSYGDAMYIHQDE